MVVDGVRFVAGTKVKHAAVATLETADTAKNLTAAERADEYQFVRLRYVEVFAAHLLLRHDERLRDARRDGMLRTDRPHYLTVVGFAPVEQVARANERPEYLGEVGAIPLRATERQPIRPPNDREHKHRSPERKEMVIAHARKIRGREGLKASLPCAML
jgi:hypothetical protein